MPRIRCHYTECVFLDDGSCGAAAVELDPDTGCATFSPNDTATGEELLEGEELEEWEDEEDEEEDSWLDDEEDEI